MSKDTYDEYDQECEICGQRHGRDYDYPNLLACLASESWSEDAAHTITKAFKRGDFVDFPEDLWDYLAAGPDAGNYWYESYVGCCTELDGLQFAEGVWAVPEGTKVVLRWVDDALCAIAIRQERGDDQW